MGCCVNELRDKEVINVCDGRRLGYVNDVEIDVCSGRVLALLVPGESKYFGFARCGDYRIPWDNIERIGDDIIIVNAGRLICPGEEDGCGQSEKKKHKFFG